MTSRVFCSSAGGVRGSFVKLIGGHLCLYVIRFIAHRASANEVLCNLLALRMYLGELSNYYAILLSIKNRPYESN